MAVIAGVNLTAPISLGGGCSDREYLGNEVLSVKGQRLLSPEKARRMLLHKSHI